MLAIYSNYILALDLNPLQDIAMSAYCIACHINDTTLCKVIDTTSFVSGFEAHREFHENTKWP